MESLITRIATLNDAPALARLLSGLYWDPVTEEQVMKRLFAIQGLETILVAEMASRAVGFASVRLVPHLRGDDTYAELTQLFVEEGYRRRGIGRALVQRVEALVQQRGATEVLPLTGTGNHEARAFYR